MPLFTTQNAMGKRDIQIRSALALMFAIGATAGFFMGIVPVDAYMTLVVMVVSFYFAKQSDEDKKPETPPTT